MDCRGPPWETSEKVPPTLSEVENRGKKTHLRGRQSERQLSPEDSKQNYYPWESLSRADARRQLMGEGFRAWRSRNQQGSHGQPGDFRGISPGLWRSAGSEKVIFPLCFNLNKGAATLGKPKRSELAP